MLSPAAGSAPSAGQVREQLARVLASPQFIGSQRLCRFLRFLVERTLENDSERLKEFVVALEVFDRNEDYDPNIDSIVRVEARRLRTKLQAYYDGPGSSDPVLIGLRPGSYVPVFQPLTAVPVATPPPPSPLSQSVTVAVLPFVNMSAEPEQDYFCDGITEEILNALASIESLDVVARTSSFQFKGQSLDIREVGLKLNAQVIVEGSVRKAGRQIRITAQAIDAARGIHLWSETYRRELDDIFAIQDEISVSIANTLRTKLPERFASRTRLLPSIDAYTGFLRAIALVYQQRADGVFAAIEQLRVLTAKYPHYAPPYAGLAAAQSSLALFGLISGAQVANELRANVHRAVELDPDSADAWAMMGVLASQWDFDWKKGEEHLRRALELQPSHAGPRSWYAMVLIRQEKLKEGGSALERVLQLNPLGPADHTRTGVLRYFERKPEQALPHTQRALELSSGEFPECRIVMALTHLQRTDPISAIADLAPLADRYPAHLGLLTAALHRAGNRDQAKQRLAQLNDLANHRYVTPLARAYAAMELGSRDDVFQHLNAAVDERVLFVQFARVDPFWDPLRQDPRFDALLTRLNLAK